MAPVIQLIEKYEMAFASNLPAVSAKMLQNYFLRAENFEEDAKENYDDKNIGYVQLLREDKKCSILGKVVIEIERVPDYFSQKVVIDENKHEIESSCCEICAKDACTHAIAFLFWLHRKSEKRVKEGDEDICFWMESQLEYELGQYVVPIQQILALGEKPDKVPELGPDPDTFVQDIVKMIKKKNIECPLGRYMCKKKKFNLTSVHELVLDATQFKRSWPEFYKIASEALNSDARKDIREKTKYRYNDPTYYLEIRYGRISSSKVYECMSKEIPFDQLYNTIMGFHKEDDTTEINRKRKIELNVRQQLEFFAKCQYENSGLFIDPEFPLIIAIPDGICDTHIVEIKCPETDKDMSRYINDKEQLTPKYYTEMQVQMYVSGKDASVVCVADPKFEENKNIYIQTVALDKEYARNAMTKAQEYWRNFIFPYELTKWCAEREDSKWGKLPSLDDLKYLDPKSDKGKEIDSQEITISEPTIANGNGSSVPN
uniref:CSON001658 protein n=1 Tax=Culicoides sonorensis TaxID=179676 RepID=A0A336KXA1_CULSO